MKSKPASQPEKRGFFSRLFGKPQPVVKTAPSEPELTTLNTWQQALCDWNAERLGISAVESEQRYRDSWNTFTGGHLGSEFRVFNQKAHKAFEVFFSDTASEIYGTYSFHSYLHMMRMLAYNPPLIPKVLLKSLPERDTLVITDFGCGLAHPSITLADHLAAQGQRVHLVLADIPTIRLEFLEWFCQRKAYTYEVHRCTPDNPIPTLPMTDIFFVRDVWEHLHDPLPYMEAFDRVLQPGAVMFTDINDHGKEFMHVHPNLAILRNYVDQAGYESLVPEKILRKPDLNRIVVEPLRQPVGAE